MKKLIFLIIILTSLSTYSQLSKKHFIPPIGSLENIGDQYLYISTPSTAIISFSIKPIGRPDSEIITGNVSNALPSRILLTSSFGQLFADSSTFGQKINDKGYIIEAEDEVYVSIRMKSNSDFHAGALVSKGASAPGLEFRMGGFVNQSNSGNYLNFMSVLATENNTKIIFDDIPTGTNIEGYSGSFPINITLNKNESYVLAVTSNGGSNPNDLIGSLAKADKPIVVNSGSSTGSFYIAPGRDIGIDQITSASNIGDEYIFVRGDGIDGWENVLIIAHESNTTIEVNGSVINGINLNAGEYYVIEGNRYTSKDNMYVKTSKNVFAYQGIGGLDGNGLPNSANQGLFFVPPLSCNNKGSINNIANIQNIGDEVFSGGVTIVTNKGATVTINDQPITDFNIQGPNDIEGRPGDYVTYKVSDLTDNVKVSSTEELYCAYFNYNGFATSGSFYSGFPTPPEVNFDLTVGSGGNCIPNVKLEAGNTEAFDSYEWYYDDGSGYQPTGITTTPYSPPADKPGKYKLVGKIDCSGETIDSQEVPVSLCPDDADGDLIIDNVDLDIDNDGILNCNESRGNVEVNLSDLDTPTLKFNDNSTDGTFVTSTTTKVGTGSFTGDADGNFTSNLDASVNSSLDYKLSFDKPSNILFQLKSGITPVAITGEEFIVFIGPSSKNITLFDPDEILLVDTDFDGVYETGINNFSSSEVRFKYNSSPKGNTPFRLVANNVTSLTFKHIQGNNTSSSSFSGNVSLTCFALDSDGDGIENALDLDSDNDGIPDIIETTGTNTVLLGTDANQDGIDDVFNGLPINLDSDNDGVINTLDLDSDNDGIYDLAESGSNALDADLDGRVDNALGNVGTNGILNSLETTPNSNILSFTIRDTDGDSMYNFLELDSDDDKCFDVIEAGFTDPNNDGVLGDLPFATNDIGKVTSGTDGYTIPNNNYIIAAPITYTLNPPSFCINSTDTMSLTSNADSFQWQSSADGTIWNDLGNDATYNGVTTNSLQITNTPIALHNTQYRVKLEKNGNSCGETTSAVSLTVNQLPVVINDPAVLKQCDSDPDLLTTFNLTEAEIQISTNPNGTFKYYKTKIAAETADVTNEITNFITYPVDGNNTNSVWVRIISEFGCISVSQLDLIVGYAADNTYDETFFSCDDFLDDNGVDTPGSNSDTDGITNFDFSPAKTNIINTFPVALRDDLDVFFYETENDRVASINNIVDISNYRNKNIPNITGTKFPIFYRIINKNNNACTGLGLMYLQINSVPTSNTFTLAPLCDDFASGSFNDGLNANINLRDNVATILGASQTEANFKVTFHKTALGANDGVSDLITNDTNYINDAPPGFIPNTGQQSRQTIFVRVENRNTGCFNDHTTFDIVINPLPTITVTNIPPIEVCDTGSTDGNPRNGLAQGINIGVTDAIILDGRSPDDFEVNYHRTQQQALDGTPDLNKTNYSSFPGSIVIDPVTGISTETLHISIEDKITGCRFGISTVQIIVYPEPNIPTIIDNYSDCDNDNNGLGDDTDGIIETISLKTQTTKVLANYPDTEHDNFKVTYHTTKAKAETGDDPLDENQYTNARSFSQGIYVRVQDTRTMCVNDDLNFRIIINPLPSFDEIDTPQIVCLNNLPLTITVQNPLTNYSYSWTDETGTELSATESVDIIKGGKYKITATDLDPLTGCSRVQEFTINESNIATITEANVSIVDDSDNNSVTIDTTNLGEGDYEFALFNQVTNTIIRQYQDQPFFDDLEGGIYTIYVRDKNGCDINGIPVSLEIPIVEFPKFFTPNGDGKNDVWSIKGVNAFFFPGSTIYIFNRYGKVVGDISVNNNTWNGTYKGKPLPSDDYWFNIQLINKDGTARKPKKGHFSLLRKN